MASNNNCSSESQISDKKFAMDSSEVLTNNNREKSDQHSKEVEIEANENYVLVDIGANLTNKKFSRDLDSVMSRAQDAGITKLIVPGTTVHSSKEALRLTRLYPGLLYSTAGIHPHEAKTWDVQSPSDLRSILLNDEVVAVGECGLDFNKNFSTRDEQLEAFEQQVLLACSVKKPLIIHERDAHAEVIAVLQRHASALPATVVHCFTGDTASAKAYLTLGCYIGITGYIWKDKNSDGVRKILESGVLPLDRLLVETDSPFMYPNTRASKIPQNVKDSITQRSLAYLQRYCTFQRNEPCSLAVTVEMIAAYMNKKPEQVALQSTFNAFKVFGLSS